MKRLKKTKNKKDIINLFRPKEETDENTIKDLRNPFRMKTIRDIRNLFKSENKKYCYKTVRVGNFWSNNL